MSAHFSLDTLGLYGNRLTGQPEIPGAPAIVFLGDSHLIQEALADSETVGAVVERQARNSGQPVNAKQYGWFDTGFATYGGVAGEVVSRRPWAVVTVVTPQDFLNPQESSDAWRLTIDPGLDVQLTSVPKPAAGELSSKARAIAARSSLALALSRRMVQLNLSAGRPGPGAGPAGPDPAVLEKMPRACVRMLRRLYGDSLLIAYAPWCRPSCQQDADPIEVRFLEACRLENASCLTIRSALAAEERQAGLLHRGFHNTGPGQGHLNRHGMRVLGESIWTHLAGRK